MRIRNVFFLFFCFLYCFFLSAYSQAAQKTELPSVDFSEIKPDCLPYKFVVTRSLSFNNESITERFFPINCTENGTDKLLMISCGYEKSFSPNYISIGGLYPQAVKFQKNYYGSTALSVSDKNFDVNNDGIKEIFLSELRPDAVYLHIIDSEGRTLHSILCAEKPYGIKGKWESVVYARAFMDINGDGTSDIIITIETDYGFKPRGIYAFDLKNNKFLWKYNTGFVPTSLLINDINGDSKREIIIGSNAPANGGGVKINGTDDSHSYLTVLDSAGKCLKSQVIGGEFTSTTVYARDLDGDGSKELMVSFTGHGIPAEADFIAVWNPVTGNFGPKISIAKTQAGNLGFTDIDRDGKDDVIIGWDDGRIELRNHNLDIIKFRKFIQFSPGRIVVADFNNDGEKEIFVSGAFRGRSVILMLSQKIELLAYVDKNLVILENCIVNQGFGKDKLLLAEGPPGVFLYNIEKQFALVHKISWGWLISGLFIGIFLAGFSYTFFAVKQSKKTARREIESV
ncbi:VCBS repeat-containing protein, partial [bacterium]|nr:VCBS repeat-containing protein [bacterium]